MNYYGASVHDTNDEQPSFLLHVSEPTRSRWNHIQHLDAFFTRVYKYHQRHGFWCMLLREIFSLNQYVFVVCLSLYLVYGIDYVTLFGYHEKKLTLDDVMYPVSKCIQNFTLATWIIITIAIILCIFKLIRKSYQMFLYWDIKQFYNTALLVKDKELDNMTWYNIQNKLKAIQPELQICIHKIDLTELDIYHRILRQVNYLVALVNKRLLPPRYDLPGLGEMVYLTKGFKLNIMILLFWPPWSLFENSWHLREEVKRSSLRKPVAANFRRKVLWLAFLNLLFSPVILLWQVLYYFFTYFELVRREPGSFGVRFWSLYAHLYIRHFNELDHELHARLTRAHKPASKYLAAFSSPTMNIIASHVTFLASAILGVFLVLSFYDNEVIYIENVLSLMAFLTGVIAISKNIVPDETTVWCPEALLNAVALHTHYLPKGWEGQAHTSTVKARFQQLFQYRFAALIEELLSPLLTPYFLLTYVYPRSLEFVDFFRNFTVSVLGVGDVCSFAQMDIKKHGDPDFQVGESYFNLSGNQYTQAEEGKVELSLMHFTATNPDWDPPEDAQEFVRSVRNDEPRPNEHTFRSLVDYNVLDSNSIMDFDVTSTIAFRHADASETLVGAVSRTEGRDMFRSLRDMRASTMILQHRRRTTKTRFAKSAEESTPLLASQR